MKQIPSQNVRRQVTISKNPIINKMPTIAAPPIVFGFSCNIAISLNEDDCFLVVRGSNDSLK